MEFKGLGGESSSGLELTIATPPAAGIDLNSLFESNDGGDGSNDENATTEPNLQLEVIVNHPPPRAGEKAPEDELTVRAVDAVEGDAAGGGSLITRRLYRKLSREQNDELEAAFQQSHFIDRSTKEALAERLKITVKQVDVWFLNRRCRLRKQQAEETYLQKKHLVEELKKKKRRHKRKIEKLKKRNKELLERLATLQAAAAAAAAAVAAAPAPPPQPSAPSVMLLPLTAGLNDALAAALNTQQGSATAAALPPSGGGSSSII